MSGEAPVKEQTPEWNSFDTVVVTSSPLETIDVVSVVADDSAGAVSSFVGTTRDTFDGKVVLYLEYEAYEPMAIKSLRELVLKMRKKWELTKVAVYHRYISIFYFLFFSILNVLCFIRLHGGRHSPLFVEHILCFPRIPPLSPDTSTTDSF